MKYNANGGQRRSRTTKLSLPAPKDLLDFAQFMVTMIELKKKYGKDIALEVLEKCKLEGQLNEHEHEFMRGLIK